MKTGMVLAALLALGAPAIAQEGAVPPPDAPPSVRDGSRADLGDFAVLLVTTDDYDGFWAEWDRPEDPADPPRVSTTATITMAKPVYAIVLFSGCRAGTDGQCDLDVEFSLTRPDGSPYTEAQIAKAWQGPPAPGRNLLASPAGFAFQLEAEDAPGPYVIRAKVTDKVASTTLAVEQTVIAAAPAPEPTG